MRSFHDISSLSCAGRRETVYLEEDIQKAFGSFFDAKKREIVIAIRPVIIRTRECYEALRYPEILA